jgi:predicted transcriptional regulator with HTH domain
MGENIAARKAQSESEASDIAVLTMHVSRSLRRSRVRTEIVMYLYGIYPEASYPAQIGRGTGIDATNVIGALRGMGSRFDKSNSLLELGLVDTIRDNGATYYKLTGQGKSLLEKLNQNRHTGIGMV